jgi:hypothetical protein
MSGQHSLQLHICEVTGSSLGPQTDYPALVFRGLPKLRSNTLKGLTTLPLPYKKILLHRDGHNEIQSI